MSKSDMNEITKKTNVLGSLSRIQRAPENFLSQEAIAEINQHGADEERRGFLRKSFVAALGGASAIGGGLAMANPLGDPAILEKQEWQKGNESQLTSLERLELHILWLQQLHSEMKKVILDKRIEELEKGKDIQGFPKD